MSTREDVLEALREAGEAGASGERLAGRLGVSRVAVGKHVAALREQGYRIDAAPGRGYALLGVPDAPLPVEVRRFLRTGRWARLTGGGVTGSTNADAAALAREGAPHGTAVLAGAQTAGRGRLGRTWVSPPGGVYVSAVLRPPLAPAALTGLPLAVAWGVAAEVGERFGLADVVRVKWPNDLRLARGGEDAGKLAGVLLEIAGEADRTAWVVAGVGLNVARPAGEVPGAASLAGAVADGAGVRAPGLAEAAAAVLDGIARGYALLLAEGVAGVRDATAPLDALRGTRVTVRDIEERIIAEGVAAGIDDQGRLLVDDPAGGPQRAIASGDVTLAGGGGRPT